MTCNQQIDYRDHKINEKVNRVKPRPFLIQVHQENLKIANFNRRQVG